VHDRRLERFGQRHELLVRARSARSGEDRHPLSAVEDARGFVEGGVVGPHNRRGGADRTGIGDTVRFGQKDLARNDDDCDAVLLDGRAHRHLKDAGRRFCIAHQLHVDARFGEERLWVRLLEVLRPDFRDRDLCGDRQNGDATALSVVQSVHEVGVPGSAAAHTNRELTGDLGLGRSGERAGLFVPDVLPRDVAVAPQGVGEAVQRVTGHPVDALDPTCSECGDQIVSNCRHRPRPPG
jgi:hypothetical protein